MPSSQIYSALPHFSLSHPPPPLPYTLARSTQTPLTFLSLIPPSPPIYSSQIYSDPPHFPLSHPSPPPPPMYSSKIYSALRHFLSSAPPPPFSLANTMNARVLMLRLVSNHNRRDSLKRKHNPGIVDLQPTPKSEVKRCRRDTAVLSRNVLEQWNVTCG